MSTYTPIATTVLTSTASSVTFNSIPQNYTDLRIVISAKMNTTTGQLYMQFNGDGGTNYSRTMMWNNNATYGSARDSNYNLLNIDYYGIVSSDRFNTQILDLMQYSNTNITKNCLFRCANSQYGNDIVAGLWNNTSAITQIVINSSQTLAVGSTFTLYGIVAGSPKASGGNIVTTDGTYWYHAFLSSGTFTPLEALTADYLVVAGGGAGGNSDTNDVTGGGGAGGYRTSIGGSALSLTAQNYAVIVGAGGAMAGTGQNGGNGTRSTFATISATGGGGGGGSPAGAGTQPGSAGGSGGGGGDTFTNQQGGAGNLGGYTPVEGYAGGNCAASSAGGGGGASAVGSNGSGASSYIGGTGGTGAYNVLTNALTIGELSSGNYYVAGGGGGGAEVTGGNGGLGGGGKGGQNSGGVGRKGVAGTANTGGGGGGSRATGSGGPNTGGSGVVIVRYAI